MRTSVFRVLSPWLAGLLLEITVSSQTWQTGPGYRFQALAVPPDGKDGFTLLTPQQTGIGFTNMLPESRLMTNQILPNGSGVAAGDVDGDGRCDLFFCGLGSGGRLFRNLGNWRFEDITDQAGVAWPNLDATGAVLADIDGDGDLDLLINSIGGGTLVFFNDGHGHFTRSPQILNAGHGGTSIALADADGDGDLDLYVVNYRASTLMDAPGTRFSVRMVDGRPEVATIDGRPLTDPEWTNRFRFKFELGEGGRGKFAHEELGEPDLFCLNDGKGHFEPVSWTGGAFLDEAGRPLSEPPFDWGLSVQFRDFNGDGWPDLYVCNDFATPDRFWLNDGHGRFRAAPALTLRQSSLASMAVNVADLNRDGFDDFMVVDMLSRDHRRRLTQRNLVRAEMSPAALITGRPQYPRNTLFLNRGDGTYAEIAQYAGLEASEWSWGAIFLDVDLDGYEDVLIPNGFERDNMNVDVQNQINQAKAGRKILSRDELMLRRMFPRLATPNLAFRNRGDLHFDEFSRAWGFDTPTISQGTCLADLDNDGDLDVIVNNLNAAAGVYRNDSVKPRIAVRLNGRPPNTRGIGSRIVVTGGPVRQSQEMTGGGCYLSGDDTVRMFAAGNVTNRLEIQVSWRNGKLSTVTNAQPNCLYEIDEAGATAVPSCASNAAGETAAAGNSKSKTTEPAFTDVSDLINHTHTDAVFDDFARQPMLGKRFSQLGPGVCWWDVDGDGWDDLVIGSGKGGQLALYQNNGRGGFNRSTQPPWTSPVTRDQTAVLGWKPGAILAGSANYEDGLATGVAVNSYRSGQAADEEAVAAWESSAGPLALADYDGDGDLDLFVGGRIVAGKYPVAAASRLYKQRAGKFVLDEANTDLLREAGLVSGAVWSDLDGDGWPDLVLACEWGPLRVFHNNRGALREITGETELSGLTGWWNGVTTGDFDGDGKMDIVATGWGQNTPYQRYRQKPLRVYYGDLDEDGTVELLESCFDPGMNKYVPIRMLDAVAKAMPFLAERFPSNQAWAEAGIDEVLADRRDKVRFGEAQCLESVLLLNRGGRFETRVLPFEAQLAPAFAACVADFDGDGCEDLFLSQNFFGVNPETSRYDAGRGLLLKGDGHGEFRAVPGQVSGIKVYGDQRGAAVGDYDGDGRVDLVVTQNGAETRLFHNTGGQPGLRVRLQGPGDNVRGIGAVVRVVFGDRFGPAREVHAGSGYWSQDSAVLVLATPEPPSRLWIRWPGGKTTTCDLPPGARDVLVTSDGTLKVVRP